MSLTPPPALRKSLHTDLSEARASLLKALPARFSASTSATVQRALMNPFFPFTFLVRNVMVVAREPGWRRSPAELKRSAILGLLEERSAFFCEVFDWWRARGIEPARQPAFSGESIGSAERYTYCTHCGGCCEIASGLPDFPAGVEIPPAWTDLFGNGLGPGHRFCPFLWEVRGSGQSVCAIHEWRPTPCRVFAEDECRFLMSDVNFQSLLHAAGTLEAARLLCRLVDPAEPPV